MEILEKNPHIIIVLADIHANLPALQAVMTFCKTLGSIDTILNLGDLVGIGPHPREVFDLMMENPLCVNLLGNHEIFLWNPHPSQVRLEDRQHYHWISEQLGTDRVKRLQSLPAMQTVQIGSYSLFLTHSRRPPASHTELPLLFQGRSLPDFRQDYPKYVNFILFGHIHAHFLLQESSRTFLCPGSVGCANLPVAVACFAVLYLYPSRWNVKFFQIPYDLDLVLHDYETRQVPDRFYLKQQFFNDLLKCDDATL